MLEEEEKRQKRGDLIIGYQRSIDLIEQGIENFAKTFIPDYHFLNYRISTFWRCAKSPIGMCVFHLSDRGYMQDCRYCHQPPERK